MTTSPATPESDYTVAEGALQFAAPVSTDPDSAPGTRTPFQIIGDSQVLYAVRPKKGVLLAIGRSVESLEAGDEMAGLAAYDQFMDSVLDPESRAYLESRFSDPTDALDIDALDPVMKGLVGHWFQGPTGGRRASAASPSTTGKRSTGRARSRGTTR